MLTAKVIAMDPNQICVKSFIEGIARSRVVQECVSDPETTLAVAMMPVLQAAMEEAEVAAWHARNLSKTQNAWKSAMG